MSDREHHNVVVVGGGPAGYTAMIYLARDGIDALCVEGFEAGGQLLRTSTVENFPGFPEGVGGAELPGLIKTQAERFGAAFAFDEVVAIDTGQRPFLVDGTLGSYSADALILATGSRARKLGLPSEEALANRGVGYCAICDGPMFAGQRVAVIGGGDAAVQQALGLTNLGCEVVMVHRRSELRASPGLGQAAITHPAITLLMPYVVEEILGVESGRVNGLQLRDANDGSQRIETVSGVFVAIGHDPATELVQGQIGLRPDGYIKLGQGSTMTDVEGVFAAGDVADPIYRQAITAAGSGCMAALDTEHWLATNRSLADANR